MKISEILKNRRKKRLVSLAGVSILFSFIIIIIFYLIFLFLPSILIVSGLIAPMPLFLLFIIALICPAVLLLRRFPVKGKNFFLSVTGGAFCPEDVQTALELENGMLFSAENNEKNGEVSAFLSGRFVRKIISSVQPDVNIFRYFFPAHARILFCVFLIFISALMSICRLDIILDVYSALRSGLPVQMISVGPYLKFDSLEAVIVPPAYLDTASTSLINLNVSSRIVIIQGSRIIVRGARSDILSGKMILSTEKGLEFFPVIKKDNNKFEVSFLAPLKGAFTLEFVNKKKGFETYTGKSRVFRISAVEDKKPAISITSPGRKYSVVFGKSIRITFNAQDDFGILEISLIHRESGSGNDFNRELVARFPKKPRRSYTSTHVWNPVLREGKKFSELVYHQSVKEVEYYLEVRDINLFSSTGIVRSKKHLIIFKDMYGGLLRGEELITQLIRGGERLLSDIDNENILKEYQAELKRAQHLFNTELKDILPQSTLERETGRILNILLHKKSGAVLDPVNKYVSFLKNYLSVLKFMMSFEKNKAASAELKAASQDMINGNHKGAFKKLKSVAEYLGSDYEKQLKKIMQLVKEGHLEEAGQRMKNILDKMRKDLARRIKNTGNAAAMSVQKIIAKIKKFTEDASALLKKQELNLKTVQAGKIRHSVKLQKIINSGLLKLSGKVSDLYSEYPFLLGGMKYHSLSAFSNGKSSLVNLEKFKTGESVKKQKRVIFHLKAFLKTSAGMVKRLGMLSKGNFEYLMPQDMNSHFVFIPQKAVYTVPVDYKNRIIELSSDRQKSSAETEAFWRDILE